MIRPSEIRGGSRRWALALLVSLAGSACLIRDPVPYEPPAPTSSREHRRTWYGGGTKRSEEAILVWSDGRVERHGKSSHWYPTGALRAERYFEHDVETGVWQEWFEDGLLRSEVDMGDGLVPAPMRFLHENGKIAGEGLGIRGVREGFWTFWFDTGLISQRGTFQAAIKDGPWSYWNPRGGKQAEGTYSMGARTGTWTLWDEAGNETRNEHPAKRADSWSQKKRSNS